MSQVLQNFTGMFDSNQQVRALRPPKYAFLHNEGSGYLHSQYLGQGVQGTATLVRCCRTGSIVVRKRTIFEDLRYNPFADQFVLHHPNIVQLLAVQNYFNEAGRAASATYWPFANGKDLNSLIQAYRTAGKRVPEILIWHFLSQILKAFNALFAKGMNHRDGHLGNVLVHWSNIYALPTFILGDLGMCDMMSEDIIAVRDRAGEHYGHGSTAPIPSDTLDLIQGPPTIQQLYHYDEDEIEREAYHYAEALIEIGEDLHSVSGCMAKMMHDDDDLDNEYYSEELRGIAVLVSNLGHFVTSRHVRTLDRMEYLLTKLRCHIEQCFAECLKTAVFPIAGLDAVHPKPIAASPLLFESVEALHAYDCRPPGPWHIAAVDPETFKVLSVDLSVAYCLDKATCTNSKGVALQTESSNDFSTSMDISEG